MSKAKKMVEWCLKKSERELKEGKRHRGLIKSEPNQKMALDHIKKAEHNLLVFLDNKKLGHYDWAINIGFYVMYHCCLSILAKFGYESRNQECTLALVLNLIEEKKIDENFKIYLEKIITDDKSDSEVLPMREKTQYSPVLEIDVMKVNELEKLSQEMLKETKGIVI